MKTKHLGSVPSDHFLVANNKDTGAGKGDGWRGNYKKYQENFDDIFRKKKPKKK